ncbi:hypothetical protein GTW43_20535 [Streptomyces sp. SID5785]|uniref:SSI family serine proteinase inhibitor n=1 Tax=Streptomyces sp. SID5785 TaxID=2690309 RepID=UPI001361A77A|nr:SSI family serine proteinase inhibitor [Streptomyces sp. SID5785]MZD07452.1 hypothetical protein [Streptomyces sp. SID5785]
MFLRRQSTRPAHRAASPRTASPRAAARLLLTAAASAAALGASLPVAAHADTGPIHTAPAPVGLLDGILPSGGGPAGDKLTLTVADSGSGNDGTYELRCAPVGGTHPEAAAACAKLDEFASDGRDPFAPVPKDALCTMQYGGPATAHITGTWHGRSVDARYSLADGCQISRWRQLSPVLPATGP